MIVRAVFATAVLAAVIIGGFFYGAVSTVCSDTAPDW